MGSYHDNEQTLFLHKDQGSGLGLDIQVYLLDCQARNLAQRTVAIYRTQLAALQNFLFFTASGASSYAEERGRR